MSYVFKPNIEKSKKESRCVASPDQTIYHLPIILLDFHCHPPFTPAQGKVMVTAVRDA